MSRWSKEWGWVGIGEDGMSPIRDRDRTCLRPLTLRIIVPATYALHQPDIPLCVLPGPRFPGPMMITRSTAVYAVRAAVCRGVPHPTPDPAYCTEQSDESTLILTRSSINKVNDHDEINQFYFLLPSAHTLCVYQLTAVVSEHYLMHKRLRADSCSHWSDPARCTAYGRL